MGSSAISGGKDAPIRRGTNKESTSEVVKIGRDRVGYHGCVGAEKKVDVEGDAGTIAEEGRRRRWRGSPVLLELGVNCRVGLQERGRESWMGCSAGFYCAGYGTHRPKARRPNGDTRRPVSVLMMPGSFWLSIRDLGIVLFSKKGEK